MLWTCTYFYLFALLRQSDVYLNDRETPWTLEHWKYRTRAAMDEYDHGFQSKRNRWEYWQGYVVKKGQHLLRKWLSIIIVIVNPVPHQVRIVLSFVMCLHIWNPLNKTIPGKFCGPGGHSKRNCYPDRANSHSSRVWEIVPIVAGAADIINWHFQNGEATCRQLSKRLQNNSIIFAAEASAITLALSCYRHLSHSSSRCNSLFWLNVMFAGNWGWRHW